MILKIIRSVWFLSMLTSLAVLLYVYAALPEEVIIQEEDTAFVTTSRDAFFYVVTAVLALVNALVFVVSRFYPKEEDFRAWFHGLVATLNVFFIIAIFLVNTVNSQERYDFARLGIFIYGSLGLVLVWATSWPVWVIWRKFSAK